MKNYKLTIEIDGDGEKIINTLLSIQNVISMGANYKSDELILEERNQFFRGKGWELKEIQNHD